MKYQIGVNTISDEELAESARQRGLTPAQELERIRLMTTVMSSWPEPLRRSLEGQTFCMDVLTEGVTDYVRTLDL